MPLMLVVHDAIFFSASHDAQWGVFYIWDSQSSKCYKSYWITLHQTVFNLSKNTDLFPSSMSIRSVQDFFSFSIKMFLLVGSEWH